MRDLPEILREYRVRIIPVERAGPLPADPENLGRRSKFGGSPDAIQGGGDLEQRRCLECYALMHFVAQIDSFEHMSDSNPNAKDYRDQQFMFGDVGMIYVWFCFQCLKP